MNCHEELGDDDLLFNYEMLEASAKLQIPERPNNIPKRIIAVDVARFGEDATSFAIIEQKSSFAWEQILAENYHKKDTIWTKGKFLDLKRQFKCDGSIVDDDGVGGGVTDGLRYEGIKAEAFKGGEKAKNETFYFNRRSEDFFYMKEMIERGHLRILNDSKLIDELMTIKFKYSGKNQRQLVSKDEMRKEGLHSPDMADALMMAVSMTKKRIATQVFQPEMAGRAY